MRKAIKKLCFGTFATVIKICGQDLTDANVVDMLTKIIDPDSRYIEIVEGDEIIHASSISRLMNCKGNFPPKLIKKGSGAYEYNEIRKNSLTNIVKLAKAVKKEDVIHKLKNTVIDRIDDDKKANIIIFLLDILQNDTDIDSKKTHFKNCFGVEKDVLFQQNEYELANFLASILLYTVDTVKVQNSYNEGNKYVNWIKPEILDMIFSYQNNKFKWDSSLQILKRINEFLSEENEAMPQNKTPSGQIKKIFKEAAHHCNIVD